MTIDNVAAELEGLFVLDHKDDILDIKLVEQFKTLNAEKKALAAKMDAIKSDLLKRITDRNAQGLVLDGRVIARKSEVTTNSVDSKRLEREFPAIYQAMLKSTVAIRFTAPELR